MKPCLPCSFHSTGCRSRHRWALVLSGVVPAVHRLDAAPMNATVPPGAVPPSFARSDSCDWLGRVESGPEYPVPRRLTFCTIVVYPGVPRGRAFLTTTIPVRVCESPCVSCVSLPSVGVIAGWVGTFVDPFAIIFASSERLLCIEAAASTGPILLKPTAVFVSAPWEAGVLAIRAGSWKPGASLASADRVP